MKMHIGVDADSGLVHTAVGTAANAHDVTQAHKLLHSQEREMVADSGYRGAAKGQDVIDAGHRARWNVAMMAGKRLASDKDLPEGPLLNELESVEVRIRAKVEHRFRVVKQQRGHAKT